MPTRITRLRAPRLWVPWLALVLVACSGASDDDDSRTAPAPATTQPVAAVPVAAATRARLDGYGALRFGMSAAQIEAAWDGRLEGAPPADDEGGCYYLSPAANPHAAYFAVMIEHGRFVRYDVGNNIDVAPGGGRRGMRAERIAELYGDRIERRPHKYVEGGQYLRIVDVGGGGGVLIFVIDATGRVSDWRVGMPPQVDYVEGCA